MNACMTKDQLCKENGVDDDLEQYVLKMCVQLSCSIVL